MPPKPPSSTKAQPSTSGCSTGAAGRCANTTSTTELKKSISDADARKFYDQQVGSAKPQEEVHARHILVESEALAKELGEKVAKGGDFVELAKEHSKDPGSKDSGGDLGYFGRGQMVPVFEETAFKLAKGEVSPPVKSQFGWHIVKVEDRRQRGAPPFEVDQGSPDRLDDPSQGPGRRERVARQGAA